MLTILFGLLLLVISAFLTITLTSYAISVWENKKVDNLASNLTPQGNSSSILDKSNTSREFTSFDLRNISKGGAKAAQDAYSRTLLHISKQEYPNWLSKAFAELNNARKNVWGSITKLVSYLISLSKPTADIDSDLMQKVAQDNDISSTIDRVKEMNIEDEHMPKPVEQELSQDEQESTALTKSASPTGATIGLASNSKSAKDMTAFEKLENRILDKMKNSGLNDYEMWIELGKLYTKYDEREKAGEVFALVLKHTKDEKQKEEARNHLIGL